MKIKDLITLIKRKYGYTNLEIASLLNVSNVTISRWINENTHSIKEETREKLSALLGFDVSKVLNNELPQFKKPILGMAKAGYDLFLDENYLGESSLTFEEFEKGDYFLKVQGDSMIGDGIKDGSLIYVKKSDQVASGKIAVVQVGEEVTVKTVIFKNKTLILEASNPAVANRYYSEKEIEELPVRILGEVLFSKTEY